MITAGAIRGKWVCAQPSRWQGSADMTGSGESPETIRSGITGQTGPAGSISLTGLIIVTAD
jgi:hypothetical protein